MTARLWFYVLLLALCGCALEDFIPATVGQLNKVGKGNHEKIEKLRDNVNDEQKKTRKVLADLSDDNIDIWGELITDAELEGREDLAHGRTKRLTAATVLADDAHELIGSDLDATEAFEGVNIADIIDRFMGFLGENPLVGMLLSLMGLGQLQGGIQGFRNRKKQEKEKLRKAGQADPSTFNVDEFDD